MARNDKVLVRYNNEERKELHKNAEKRGFTTLSDYIRNRTIGERERVLEEKMLTLENLLKSILKKLEKKKW